MKEIRNRIELAKINQQRSKQINEKQTRRVQDLVKDAEVDEFILSKLEEEKNKEKEKEIRKKMENLQSKYMLQKQMQDKERLREEAQLEYQRDKNQVDEIVRKLIMEDLNMIEENKKKKEQLKDTMIKAYEDKENRKRQMKEEERLQKEKEKQYFEEVARRDKELQMKKAAAQEEKDRIFDRLAAEAEKKQAEKDYWENVRNELYVEEQRRKDKIKELQDLEKKQRLYLYN